MNEETENLVNKALAGILENAAKAQDFVLSEAPEIVNQLLMWKTVCAAMWVAIAVCLLIAAAFFIRLFIKAKDEEDYDKAEIKLVAGSVGGIFSLLSGIFCFIGNLSDLLQLILAPKIYLIEYAANLMN